VTTLLMIGLLLAACGRGRQAEAVPTATLIPTLVLEAPTATPVPTVEPTAEPTVEPTAEPTVASTEAVTATETVTTGAEITETTAVTATEAVTAEAEMITSAEVTATEAVTSGAEVTNTTEVTGTEAVTAGAEITSAEGVTATETVTASEEITVGADMTGTGSITGSITESITETEAMTTTAAPVRVFFLQPTDNAILPITSTVVMSYTGVTLHHADEEEGHVHVDGEVHDVDEGLVHLHLLVDTDFAATGEEIAEDEQHTHLMEGVAPVELALAPGSHVLRLQLGDGDHMALPGDEARAEIVVSVIEGAAKQSVRIASPTAGATVPPTLTVVMAAAGLSVEPAGVVVENAGHLHLLVDSDFVEAGTAIPDDETHLHFDAAQLTGTVTLEPGEHVLRLQFADGEHTALEGGRYRDEITVNVVAGAPATQVMFVEPEDGATVESPFHVAWAAAGLTIEAAGQVLRPEGGHLHLLIDEDFAEPDEVIAADDTHLHFGKAQTETELELEPGEYTLRLQMANGAHMAQDGSQYQDEITITVE
jgi:hypothetical protein